MLQLNRLRGRARRLEESRSEQVLAKFARLTYVLHQDRLFRLDRVLLWGWVEVDGMHEVEARLTRLGNSTALVLPREVLDAAGMERGDSVTIRVEPGRVVVDKTDTLHSRALAAMREGAVRYRSALMALAK